MTSRGKEPGGQPEDPPEGAPGGVPDGDPGRVPDEVPDGARASAWSRALSRHRPRVWASVAAKIAVVVSTAVVVLTEDFQVWIPGTAAFVLFLALQWKSLVPSARVLVLVVAALGIALPLMGLVSVADLHRAADRALYLAFFVISLGVLQDAASASPFIHQCGAILINQPPGRRYSVLTAGGGLLGVLLSLGAVGLLAGMIAQGIERTRAASGERVAMIRTQRMTLASLRGVVSVPLWSPTSIAMPLVMAGLPGLTWLGILPLGATIAGVLLLLGWFVDRVSFNRVAHDPGPTRAGGAMVLAKLVALIAMLPLLGSGVGALLGISMISAILLIAPFLAILWHGIQQRPHGGSLIRSGVGRFFGHSLPRLTEMRSEIAIFGASGALGILVMPLIDIDALGAAIDGLGLGAGWLLFIGYLFIVATSILGLNAIVSVTVFVGVAAQLPGHDLSQLAIALTALYSWSIAAGVSSLSASVRLAARPIGQSPSTVGFRWNGRYSLAATLLAWGLCMGAAFV